MSYIQGLGATPPFPGAIWVPPSGGRAGYWTRPPSTKTTRPVTVTVTKDSSPERKELFRRVGVVSQCRKTGMPEELVPTCAAMIDSGMTMHAVVAELQKAAMPTEIEEAVSMEAAQKRSKLLLYGGAIAVPLVLFMLLRKKKPS